MPTLLPILLMFMILSGCVAASEYIAGASLKDDPDTKYPSSLESVRIGVTTKEQVRQLFGYPTDTQVSSRNGISRESWAYAAADPVIQPYQYIPLIGAYAFYNSPETQSFSVNFSQEGIAEGLSWRTMQAFGNERYDLIKDLPGSEYPSYGTKNPMAHNLSQTSDSPSDN